MDQEVARTLAELELKLRELERELASVGMRQSAGAPEWAPPPAPPPPLSPEPRAEERPFHQPVAQQPGTIVDEVTERRYSMDAQQTVYGEIPATRDAHGSIDLGDLVRFRETMHRTLQTLIDEYSRLLSLRPPAGS